MVGEPADLNEFDDVDSDVDWDLPNLVHRSDLSSLSSEQLTIITDHKRRLKRIEALKKIFLALIAGLPAILAMVKSFIG